MLPIHRRLAHHTVVRPVSGPELRVRDVAPFVCREFDEVEVVRGPGGQKRNMQIEYRRFESSDSSLRDTAQLSLLSGAIAVR